MIEQEKNYIYLEYLKEEYYLICSKYPHNNIMRKSCDDLINSIDEDNIDDYKLDLLAETLDSYIGYLEKNYEE